MDFFNLILVHPLLNALFFLDRYIPGHDLGISIILLTVIIRFILYIPSLSAIKSQRQVQEMQPKLDALKKKYKDNREELGRQMMKFYKDNKVNPFSSCLPLLIQMPILYALFRVFFDGLSADSATGILVPEQLNHLYGSLRDYYAVTPIKATFLGLVDLTKTNNYVLAFLAAAFQFIQSKMLVTKQPPKNLTGAKDENIASSTSRTMTYLFPILIFYFSLKFSAGLALYWVVATLFVIAQQYFYFKKHPVKKEQAVIEQK